MNNKDIYETDLIIAEDLKDYWKFIYKENQIITLEKAKEIVSYRMSITNNKKLKILVVLPQKIEMHKGARDYLSSMEGTANILATAIVVASKYSYFLSKFFVKLNPPKTPVKIFETEQKAIEWLNKI